MTRPLQISSLAASVRSKRSADWQRKRERMTRALIVVLAARAAKGCGDQARFDQYARAAREILSGDLTVDGLSPKFFSPTTKRLVSAKIYWLKLTRFDQMRG